MQAKFLIFIAVVFVITITFGILIWRQTLVFEKKALAAKQRKEEYLLQLEAEMEEQKAQAAREQELAALEEENGEEIEK